MKKLIHSVLAVSTLAVCIALTGCDGLEETTDPVEDEPIEKSEPDNSLEWGFDEETGTLTVGGEGSISAENVPWAEHIGQIVNVVLEEGIQSIEAGAFSSSHSNNYAKLKSVAIAGSVIGIEDMTFSGCSLLESVTFGKSEALIFIGQRAFGDCTALKSITIPGSVEEIRNGAFMNCTSIENIVVPNSVVYMEACVFQGCTSLVSATLPDNFGAINYSTFEGCTSLKQFTIPDAVQSILDGAFKDCTALESVTIGSGTTDIRSAVFQGCTSLADVFFMSTTPPDIHEDSFVYDSTAHVPKGSLEVYKLLSWEGFIFAKVVEQQ